MVIKCNVNQRITLRHRPLLYTSCFDDIYYFSSTAMEYADSITVEIQFYFSIHEATWSNGSICSRSRRSVCMIRYESSNSNLLQALKTKKTRIQFFTSSKNVDLIFYKLKKLKKHGFNFLSLQKMKSIFFELF